jgi:hypothetical protein
VAIQSSRPNTRLFSNVVEAGVRAGPGKRLLRHLQNALAVPLRIGARFAKSSLSILGGHSQKKLQPETLSGYLIY